MLESASARVHEATAATRKLSREQAARLGALEADAAALTQRYGQQLPVAPADAEPLAPPAEEPTAREHLAPAFESYTAAVEKELTGLKSLVLPRLFVGVTPWAAGLLVVVLAALLGHAYTAGTLADPKLLTTTPVNWLHVGIAAGVGLVVAVVVCLLLGNASRRRVRDRAETFATTHAAATAAVTRDVGRVTAALDEDLLSATAKHQDETRENRRAAEARDEQGQGPARRRRVRRPTPRSGSGGKKLAAARAAAEAADEAARTERVGRIDAWQTDARATLAPPPRRTRGRRQSRPTKRVALPSSSGGRRPSA